MARSPEAQHDCPLLNRRVYWGDCYEVQDIREDSMDAFFFLISLKLMKQILFVKNVSGTRLVLMNKTV